MRIFVAFQCGGYDKGDDYFGNDYSRLKPIFFEENVERLKFKNWLPVFAKEVIDKGRLVSSVKKRDYGSEKLYNNHQFLYHYKNFRFIFEGNEQIKTLHFGGCKVKFKNKGIKND